MSQMGTYSIGELAELLDARLVCPAAHSPENTAARQIQGIATLQKATANDLSFLANPKYLKYLAQTQAAAVLVTEEQAADAPVPCLVTPNPYLAYARASGLFDAGQQVREPGVHPSAVIDAAAKIAASAWVGAQCVIEAGAEIGEHACIGPGSVIGAASVVGANTRINANVTIYHGVQIGEHCIIHSGAVIGADGFGFAPGPAGWQKIHQLGGVRIGDRVEIGAGTTVDRGALDDTVIGNGVILDNQVQIAHNVVIGENTAIAGCTAVAGSTHIGRECTIAGAVGIIGHLQIADKVHISAMSLVTKSIREPGSYSSGTAMQETKAWRRNAVRFGQLDNWCQRITALENKNNKS